MPAWLQAILFFLSTLLLLRISGKKTLAQMTPSEAIIMIGIGTVLVHPLKNENSWLAIYHGALIVAGILLTSFVLIKIPSLKKWVMGEPIVLVKDGEVQIGNVHKSRMTVDELYEKLRMAKVDNVQKVKWATLEVGGNLAVQLKEEYSYATKKDLEELKQAMLTLANQQVQVPTKYPFSYVNPSDNLFSKVEKVQEQDPLQ
jgi:uncharacterized membrane protein YcaP (DUF421 family)